MPKYVVSTTLEHADGPIPRWSPEVPTWFGAWVEVDGDLLVAAALVGTLLKYELVDELRLMVFPVVLAAASARFPSAMRRPPRVVTAAPLRSARSSSTAAGLSTRGAWRTMGVVSQLHSRSGPTALSSNSSSTDRS